MTLPLPMLPARHPRWTYIAADLRTGTLLEEIPLGGVRYSRLLNGSGTLDGSFAYTARAAALLRPATTPARTALYALRDNQVMWGGIIWTRRVDHDTRIVQLGCADWWSYYDHRFITSTVDFIDVDQNDVARSLVATAAAATGGDIGITVSSGVSGRLLDRSFDWFNYAKVADALRQLAEDEGGADLRFDTTGNLDIGITRQLVIGTPHLGRSAADSGLVIDYGGHGSVLQSLVEAEDGSSVESVHYALGPGSEEAKLIGVATRDALTATGGWPLLEGTTSYNDDTLDSDAAINAKARADLDARAGIRTLPTGTTRTIEVGTLDPGDEVLLDVTSDWYNGDASSDTTQGRWTQPTRVTAFTVTVPDDGSNETVEPTFGDLVVVARSLVPAARVAPNILQESSTAPATDSGDYGAGAYGSGPFGL